MVVFQAEFSDLLLQFPNVFDALCVPEVVCCVDLVAVGIDVGAENAGNTLVISRGVNWSGHVSYVVALVVLDVEVSLPNLYVLMLVFEIVCVLVILALFNVLGLGLCFEARLQKQLSGLSMLALLFLKSRVSRVEDLSLGPLAD